MAVAAICVVFVSMPKRRAFDPQQIAADWQAAFAKSQEEVNKASQPFRQPAPGPAPMLDIQKIIAQAQGSDLHPQTPKLAPEQRFDEKPVNWPKAMRTTLDLPPYDGRLGLRTLSDDGATVVIGPAVYQRGPKGLYFVQKLNVPAEKGESFSWRDNMVCQVAGDWIAISTPSARRESGVVHLFQQTAGVWEHKQRLTPSDASPNGHFGTSLDVEGGVMLVSAPEQPNEDAQKSGVRREGAVYLFRLKDGQWQETARLGADGFPVQARWSLKLGKAVQISGTQVAISGQSDQNTFASLGQLKGDKIVWEQELTSLVDGFGDPEVMALDGKTLVTHASVKRTAVSRYRGAEQVLIFEKEAGGWRRTAELVATDFHELDAPLLGFGKMVSVHGDLVSATRIDQSPRGFVFQRSSKGTWAPVADEVTSKGPICVAGRHGIVSLQQGVNSQLQLDDVGREGVAAVTPQTVLAHMHESCLEQRKDGLFYVIGQKQPFTGKSTARFAATDRIKFQGSYEKGLPSGEHETLHASGRRSKMETYKDGKLTGEVKSYDEDGNLLATAVYEAGVKKSETTAPAPGRTSGRSNALSLFGRSSGSSANDLNLQMMQLEQAQRQKQMEAEMYMQRAHQEATESANREMRRYREQMSGRMGALGISSY